MFGKLYFKRVTLHFSPLGIPLYIFYKDNCKVVKSEAKWQVNTPRVHRAFVENFSDAPRAQDNLSKLLTAISAIAAPSAGTLTKNVHKFEGCRH